MGIAAKSSPHRISNDNFALKASVFLRQNDLYNRLALLYYGTLFLGGELVSTA